MLCNKTTYIAWTLDYVKCIGDILSLDIFQSNLSAPSKNRLLVGADSCFSFYFLLF